MNLQKRRTAFRGSYHTVLGRLGYWGYSAALADTVAPQEDFFGNQGYSKVLYYPYAEYYYYFGLDYEFDYDGHGEVVWPGYKNVFLGVGGKARSQLLGQL